MRIQFVRACVVGFAGVASAQSPAIHELNLRGDRFKPLTYEQMTPEQKKMTDSVMSGDRGSMVGPYNVMLRSPEMGDLAQKFGAQMRFHSTVPKKLNEFAIILTARFMNNEFEWSGHRRAAIQAGLSPAVADALAAWKRPSSMQPDEEVVYSFCSELFTGKQVSDSTFQAALKLLGERGMVDLMGVMGYYEFTAMLMNVDRYPLPEGVKPELKPFQ